MPTAPPLPMTDLHIHAESSARLDALLASRDDRVAYDWSVWAREVATLPPGAARLQAMSRDLIAPEVDADPVKFRARIEQLLLDAAALGAIYVEVRFGRDTITREDFMTGFRDAERRVIARHPHFRAEALATLVPQRDWPHTEMLVEACLRASSEGLAGVDIIPEPYDQEADWSAMIPVAERLAGAGLGITVHAGEFSTANLRAALSLPGVTRIGHGIQAAFDPPLLDLVRRAAVALETCVTSNVILGAVDNHQVHPLKQLVDAAIPVTINTDNPVRFRTDIRREYELASRLGLTSADLATATRTAIDFAFTSDERRQDLHAVAEAAGA